MTFNKKTIQLLLISTIGIVFIIYLCGCFRLYEPYTGWQGMSPRPIAPAITEEDVAPLRKQLEGLFVQAGEALCPSFNMVKEEIAKGKKGSKEQKDEAAVAQMRKEAGGKIYDCRSYPDHLQVPADIGDIITASSIYLDKKLGGLLERVEAALSCKPIPIVEGEGDEEEGFQVGGNYRNEFMNEGSVRPEGEHYRDILEYYADVPSDAQADADICSPDQMKTREAIAAADAAKASAASCRAPQEINYAQQKQLLEARIKNLARALKDTEWAPRIQRVKATLGRFQEIKAKVDAGTLVPNCGAGF